MSVRRATLIATAVALILAIAIAGAVVSSRPTARHTITKVAETHPSGPARHQTRNYRAPSPAETATLPEARYDAVIAGLMPATSASAHTAYSIAADTPIYGTDRETPIARLAATNFLGGPTVVVPVERDGDWARVLTPARRVLPSESGGDASAQTAGWIRADVLIHPVPLPRRIEVSVSAQTLVIVVGDTIEHSFRVGVGTTSAPTPHGVVGYLQARYLDPAQNQTRYPVQLTSLHSSAADEPFAGADGGLIGVHYERTATGAVSHGCIRLSVAAIEAVDALPLGTLIAITS